MTILYIVLILAGTALLSWPLAKVMTWAMDPGEIMSSSRGGLERLIQKAGGPLVARQQD